MQLYEVDQSVPVVGPWLEGWQWRLDPSINILDYMNEILIASFRKHQRLALIDWAVKDMWSPHSEPNMLKVWGGGGGGASSTLA